MAKLRTNPSPHTTNSKPKDNNSAKQKTNPNPNAGLNISVGSKATTKAKSKKTKDSNRAKPQFNHYEQKRLDRIRERDERKANKEEKLLVQKRERMKKLKILSKKNRKGQPLMNGRIELLLGQIERSLQS